jgi:3-hydroxyisobutyrate dehydrogenase-like beta-hydroxyacid dehydrogenase
MNTQERTGTVGFAGLGQMGGPMAENVIKKGYSLVVYDIDREKLDHFVALGAKAASNPAEVARRASTVVSMVDTTAQAEEVIVGTGGLVEAAEAGDVIVRKTDASSRLARKTHSQ